MCLLIAAGPPTPASASNPNFRAEIPRKLGVPSSKRRVVEVGTLGVKEHDEPYRWSPDCVTVWSTLPPP